VFAFTPERCSPSERNAVRIHNGMVFAFTAESRSPSTGFPKQIKISFQICADDATHSHSSGLPANSPASGYDPLPLFEDVLLGAEPVLFVLARFATTALI
jgi:hypothetical protein